jgi:hypothetical protein
MGFPRMRWTRLLHPTLSMSFLLAPMLAACASDDGSPTSPTNDASTPTAGQSVRFAIDSGADRHPISPYIYGVNQAAWNGRHRYLTLGRLGGNRWTAYNWETNASNAGADWNHQNDDYLGGGLVPGEAARPYIAAAHAAGASVVVTIPMVGYVSADKGPSGDVNQTPDYLNARFLVSQARKGRPFEFPPNTSDRIVYQDEYVAWLESTFAYARQDPRRTLFYSLDNEPDLWSNTHPRIRPTGKVTYAEMVSRTTEWASAIKRVAPQALVFGFVSYGWNGFVTLQGAPDAGGRDFIDFFLAALRGADSQGRLLDVLDLHWYPEAQGSGVRVTAADATPAVAAARVQAPRSLWDSTYVEQSWISQAAGVGAIRLIPRIKAKIAAQYPGTKLAFTEYDYGGGAHISGGIAQADVLGIFGREDVFAATRWGSDADLAFVSAGFAAFTNFDGSGGRFGDTSVHAETSNVADTSVYASVDASDDRRMVIVAINKATSPTTAEITVNHSADLAQARAYQLTASSATPVASGGLSVTARNLYRLTMPGSSVTTVVLTR